MKNFTTHTVFILIGLAATAVLSGQDVGAVVDDLKNIKDRSLNITGGLSLGLNAYNASGIAPRRDDLQWNARANLSLEFLGLSAPFSVAFSDANRNFNLPSYTFAGISPTYKWIRAHAGDRSMSFSRYTMDGISFRGGGLELSPGKFRLAGFYGSLNRALLNDLNAVGNLNGFYERTGFGGKIGFEGEKGGLNLVLFSAADDPGDNPLTNLNNRLTPLQNTVVSFSGRQQLGKRLTLSGEAAHSLTNQDRLAEPLQESELKLSNELFGLFSPNQSITTGQAYRVEASFNLEKSGLRAGYERISRGFRTLGALFFNNDTENITGGFTKNLFNNKLSLAANAGLERTNLDAEEAETTDRFIGSATANFRPTDKWMFNAGYSNFRNDTKLRGQTDPFTPVDSIFLAQVTQSVNGMILRRLGSDERPSTITLSANHQRANNIINDVAQMDNQTIFTNLALNFSSGNPAKGFQYHLGVTGNTTELGDFNNRSISPALGLTKTFANNALSTQLRSALSFITSPTHPDRDNSVLNLSLGLGYKLKSGHSINLSAIHLNRFGAEDPTRNFREWYGTATYGYRFGGKLGGKRPSAPNSQK